MDATLRNRDSAYANDSRGSVALRTCFVLYFRFGSSGAQNMTQGTVQLVSGILTVVLVIIIILRRKNKKKAEEDDF